MNMAMGWIAFHRVPLQPKNEKSMKPPVKFSPESVTAICDTRKHTARPIAFHGCKATRSQSSGFDGGIMPELSSETLDQLASLIADRIAEKLRIPDPVLNRANAAKFLGVTTLR